MMSMQAVCDFKDLGIEDGGAHKMRTRARGLRDKRAANELMAKARELDVQTEAFAEKHAPVFAVRFLRPRYGRQEWAIWLTCVIDEIIVVVCFFLIIFFLSYFYLTLHYP